jgi:hypothetical protein
VATLEEVERAFMKAHQAGDKANAKVLADEVRRLRADTGPTIDKALKENAQSELSSASTLDPTKNPYPTRQQYEQAPGWVQRLSNLRDSALLAQRGFFGGTMERIPAAGRSLLPGSEGYSAELKKGTDEIERAKIRLGGPASTVSELGGALAQPMKGKLGTDIALGASYGALANDKDPLTGAAFGGGGAAAGSAIGAALAKGGTEFSKLWSAYAAEPSAYAKQMLFEAGQKMGLTAADVRSAIREHGSETMAADVLGKPGTAIGRRAANVSPEAREVVEAATSGRKAGQNERVLGTMEEIAGLPGGGRRAVDDLKEETRQLFQPGVSRAYKEAAAAGYDLPRTPFEDLHQSPMFQKAYDQAENDLKNRVAAGQADAGGELARYDETKKIIDSVGSQAARAGDRNTADQALALSRRLREVMDTSMAGPEYAGARAAGQKAAKAQEAIDTGQKLAGNRIPTDLPGKAQETGDHGVKRLIAQGYTLEQAQNLLNKGSTEATINLLRRPAQQEAAQAALGPQGSERLNQRLGTENMFNATNRELVGNSTTARQLVEAGLLGAGGAAGGYLTGYADPLTGGALGFGLKARSLGKTAAENIASKAFQKAAPDVAEHLVGSPSTIPFERVIPAGKLEMAAPELRDWLTRLMTQGSISAGGR